jgi:DNA polymerase-2
MGTPGCRFFDPRLPSSITLRGHEIMLKTKGLIEEEGHQVIYGDTDSIFVWLNLKQGLDAIDQIGKALALKVNSWWQQYLETEYQLTSALELEYENHYTRFLMPTIRGSSEGTKKRYAGMVCSDEFDPDDPQAGTYSLIFKGLETVRTDWTLLAREFQKELYDRVFLNKEYKAYILELITDLKEGRFDDKLVYRKRLRRHLNEYQKNIPPHVQAAKKAEQWLLSQGKRQRYQRGGWIEYCYTLNGPEPLENLESPLDYDLYIERQIAPVVDGIVMFLGTSFDEITSKQLNLI